MWVDDLPKILHNGLNSEFIFQSWNGHRLPSTMVMLWTVSHLHIGPATSLLFSLLLWPIILWAALALLRVSGIIFSAPMLLALLCFLLSFAQREVLFFFTANPFPLVTIPVFLCAYACQKRNWILAFATVPLGMCFFSSWLAIPPMILLARYFWLERRPNFKYNAVTAAFIIGAGSLAYLFFGHSGEHSKGGPHSLGAFTFGFFRVLGNPFIMIGKHQTLLVHLAAAIIGLSFFALWFLVIRIAKQERRLLWTALVPIYSVGCAAMVAYSRSGMGIDEIGIGSKYCSLMIPGWFAIFVCLFSNRIKLNRTVFGVTAFLLTLGIAMSAINLGAELFIRAPKLRAIHGDLKSALLGRPLSPEALDRMDFVDPVHGHPAEALRRLSSELPKQDYEFLFN